MPSVRASAEEQTRPLAGDTLIPEPIAALTHAITIRAESRDVWPWLAQMGAGRAGWYSYDLLDNGGRPSADRIVPEFQRLEADTLFPALPGASDGFTLAACETGRSLVIGWRAPGGGWLMTWAFVLEPSDGRATRLVVRVRGGRGYTFHGLPWWLAKRIVPIVHFVMQRRQLLGIARRAEQADVMLDRFMPRYDIVERHAVSVSTPAEVALAAACEADLTASPIIRAIFRAREIVLRSRPPSAGRPRGLLALTTSLGWRVLTEAPGREVVVGSVTQPWLADVVFRPLPPDQFAAFGEPDYVKIAWTLRADPDGPGRCVLRTETRAVATDEAARKKFLRYWSRFSPGIILIRRLMLGPIRREAEKRIGRLRLKTSITSARSGAARCRSARAGCGFRTRRSRASAPLSGKPLPERRALRPGRSRPRRRCRCAQTSASLKAAAG